MTKMILYIYKGESLRIAFAIMALVLLLAGGAGAATLTVNAGGGANYTKIQDAINNASSGDTILVYSGAYYENVHVTKQLILRGINNGSGNPVVNAQRSGSSITISADGITLDGFVVINSGINEEGSGGVFITSNNNTIINNTIGFNINGIYISSSYKNTIISNNIINNQFNGIYIEYSSMNSIVNDTFTNDGIFVDYAYQNNVTNNTVNGKPLVYLENVSDYQVNNTGQVILVNDVNITLENLDLSNTTVGAELWNTSLSTVANNSFNDNYCGICLGYSTKNDIANNIFTNDGIFVKYSYQNNVTNNTVNGKPLVYLENVSDYQVNNTGQVILVNDVNIAVENMDLSNTTVGAELWNTSLSTVTNNSLNSNQRGIYVGFFSNNNTITSNIANNNSLPGIFISSSINNIISNNTACNNVDGIYLQHSINSIFTSNYICNNKNGGIHFQGSNNGNSLYNNYFNNSNNLVKQNSSENTWNITKTSGTNIVGGPYLGGNVWANPSGAGFSQICLDGDYDGICDSNYTLDNNNTDYLPLSYKAMPVIIGFAPVSNVSDLTGATRTFTIVVNQTMNVTWYINGTAIFNQTGVTESDYVNTSAGQGTWNVSAIASNTNGRVMQMWNWTVIPPIVVTIISPDNNSINTTGYVNVTVKLDRNSTALLNWNGTNESMIGDGINFYKNKTGLLSGNYSLRAYANDLNGVFDASETRIVTVNRAIVDPTIETIINTTTFITNATLEITAPSGNATVIIPNGTNASVGGVALTNISIDSLAKLNSTFVANLGSDKLVGENLSIGPAGAQFSPDIQIRFNYTDAQLTAAEITAFQLRVKFYNTTTNTWVEQTPYILDTTDKYITANVSHFSTFALLGTPITTTATSSSGGGGGGGGSGSSGENYTNILVKENYDLFISKDIVTSYAFTNNSNPIKFVNITANISAGEINVAVEVLKRTSTLVNISPPGMVYKNMNILVGTSGFAVPKNIKEAIIGFKVYNSWLLSNNLEGSDVKMVRWNGSEWATLQTLEKTKNSTYTYYEAKTDSFSPFAITALKASAIPNGTLIALPNETSVAPQVTKPINPTPTITQTSPVNLLGLTYIYSLMAVILITVIVIVLGVLKRRIEKK